VSAEELAAEQVATQEVVVADVRAEIVNEYGFDDINDSDKIDRLVERELDNRKKLSSAIGQKIKLRNERDALKNTPPQKIEVVEKSGDLSSKDLIALISAKIPEDDVDEVVEYSRFKKISIGEALKSSVIRASLAERAEQRTTAAATNTAPSRRGPTQLSDEARLESIKDGKFPESDADIQKLMEAKINLLRKK